MRFIKYLISENPGKMVMICLILLIACLYIITPTQSTSYSDPIISQFKLDNSFCYITKSDKGLDLLTFSEVPKIVNNRIMIVSELPFRGLEIFIAIVIFIIIFVASFNSDGSWDITDVKVRTYIKRVKIDVENGVYYYSYNGKLLFTSDHLIDSAYRYQRVKDALWTYFSSSPNLYTDYVPLRESRDNKLKKATLMKTFHVGDLVIVSSNITARLELGVKGEILCRVIDIIKDDVSFNELEVITGRGDLNTNCSFKLKILTLYGNSPYKHLNLTVDVFITNRTHDIHLLMVDDTIKTLSNKINDLKDWIDYLQKNRNRSEKLDILLNE